MVRTMRDPGVIRLVLLGGVDALDAAGQRIEPLLAQPRRLALLAMLAIESMQGGCPRERLMATFWPDHSPEAAAANLRQAVAFLRGLLGDEVVAGQGRHALAIGWEHLQCDAVDALRRLGSGAPVVELMPGFHLKESGEPWGDWLAEQRRRLAPPRGRDQAEPLPADARARAAYLHGRFHWTRRPRESMKALACLQQAVELAPNFAPAHAALADVYNTLGSWESGALAPADSFPQARALARRALQIDACCAAAHTSLAYATAHHDWQWDHAETQFARAIELDPGYAHAHHWRAHLLVAQQRFDEALQSGQRALELQPLDIIINVHMAWHHWLARDAEAAIEQAARTADLDDTDHWPPFFHGMACALAGRAEDAVDALRRSCALSKGNAVMRAGLGYAYAFAQDRRAARAVLREFDDAAQAQHRFAYEAAVIHAALGDTDRAFTRLQDALQARSGWMAYLRVDPRLDVLREDPRYLALERAIGFPPRG
jgi:tetratricopeptide (TPR) repeat protein